MGTGTALPFKILWVWGRASKTLAHACVDSSYVQGLCVQGQPNPPGSCGYRTASHAMGGCRFCHNDKGLREQGWPHVSRAYACGDSLVGAGLVGSKMTSPIIFVGAGMASNKWCLWVWG